MTKIKPIPAKSIDELENGKMYKIVDLKSILRNMGLNYSIFTIRDYETYKCLDYTCGQRHNEKPENGVCAKCGGEVREPLIISPRTRGGGTGYGHRRYTKDEIIQVVEVFKKRS